MAIEEKKSVAQRGRAAQGPLGEAEGGVRLGAREPLRRIGGLWAQPIPAMSLIRTATEKDLSLKKRAALKAARSRSRRSPVEAQPKSKRERAANLAAQRDAR